MKEQNAKARLFVRCLAPTDTAKQLKKFFKKFGGLDDAYVIMDPKNEKISKGYGFVNFFEEKFAREALESLQQFPHPKWNIRQYIFALGNQKNLPDTKSKNSLSPQAQESENSYDVASFQNAVNNFSQKQAEKVQMPTQKFSAQQMPTQKFSAQQMTAQKMSAQQMPTQKILAQQIYSNYVYPEIRYEYDYPVNYDYIYGSVDQFQQPGNGLANISADSANYWYYGEYEFPENNSSNCHFIFFIYL